MFNTFNHFITVCMCALKYIYIYITVASIIFFYFLYGLSTYKFGTFNFELELTLFIIMISQPFQFWIEVWYVGSKYFNDFLYRYLWYLKIRNPIAILIPNVICLKKNSVNVKVFQKNTNFCSNHKTNSSTWAHKHTGSI